MYDSSFVFTEAYRKVFREVVSSYFDSVHSDAVNILSVEDIFPPNSGRRLESSNHTLNFKPFAPDLEIMPKRMQTSKSRFVFASLNKSSPTKRKSSGNFKETLHKFSNRRRRKLQQSGIPIGNQIFFKINDVSQALSSSMALQIRQMESGFMETLSPKVAQLTEPAKLQSRFWNKISVVSGSGEEPKEIYVPEMQQMIDGDCGEQGAIRKILPNGTIYCKTTTSIKVSNSYAPRGKSSFKINCK